MNGPQILCAACQAHINSFDENYVLGGEALAALEELVELKRMKDAGTTPTEYERRKAIAWREAFRVCGVIGDPKP